MELKPVDDYQRLLGQISKTYTQGQVQAFRAVNTQLLYPNGATPSHKLTWSHVVELLKIENDVDRRFYENQTLQENWSVRELKRQKYQLYLPNQEELRRALTQIWQMEGENE